MLRVWQVRLLLRLLLFELGSVVEEVVDHRVGDLLEVIDDARRLLLLLSPARGIRLMISDGAVQARVTCG